MDKKIKDPAESSALLIVDMISDFEFTDGEQLFKHAVPAANKILELKRRAQAAGWPVIYVNDNYGQWNSSSQKLLQAGVAAAAVPATSPTTTDERSTSLIETAGNPIGIIWVGAGLIAFYIALTWLNLLLGVVLTPLFLIPQTWLLERLKARKAARRTE